MNEPSQDIVIFGGQGENAIAPVESARLYALHRASIALTAHTDPDVVLHQVLRNAVGLLGADSGSLYRWDVQTEMLHCIENWQVPAKDSTPAHPPGRGLAGQVFSRREAIIVNNYPDWEHADRSGIDGGLRAGLGVPLVRSGRLLGVVLVRSYQAGVEFSQDDARLLGLFADQAAIVTENAQLYAAARESLSKSLEVEQELREAHRFMQSALDALATHIAILDETGQIIAVNAAWRRFAEESGGHVLDIGVGANYLRVREDVHGPRADEAPAMTAGILAVMRGEREEYSLEYPCHDPAERRWFKVTVTRFASPGPRRVVIAHENITARKLTEEALRSSEERLAFLAFHDSLTNLPNRALLYEHLERALATVQANDRQMAVLFLDLDGFKAVNDGLGHGVGDGLLAAVARRLETCVGPNDMVARLGGDEFAVVLEDLTAPEQADAVASAILDAMQTPFTVESYEMLIACSIGVAFSTADTQRPGDLLRNADTALYTAKRAGKARYAVFTRGMRWITGPLRQRLWPDRRGTTGRLRMRDTTHA